MRLLIVVMNYYPSVGGTQIFFKNLAEYCVHHLGYEVQVITTDSYFGPEKDIYKKIVPAEERINGVWVKRFPYRRWHRRFFLLMQKILFAFFNRSSSYLSVRRTGPWSTSLQKAITHTDADVIVGATSVYKYMAYPVTSTGKTYKKPFLFQGALHFHEGTGNHLIAKHILQAIQQSQTYLANSAFEKEMLVRNGILPEKIAVLSIATEHNVSKLPFDPLYRDKMNIAPEQPVIAFVGRISELKSIDVLIGAMALVHRQMPDAHLIIAGDDSGYSARLKILTTNFTVSLQEKIHFRLNVDDQEKNSIYHSLNVLVLPSKLESFGLVFLEAWAFRKAVIGAKIGAINSIIEDGVDGILFNPDDVAHLSSCIISVLQNSKMQQSLGYAGNKKLLEHYTWDVVGKKFAAICKNAVLNF